MNRREHIKQQIQQKLREVAQGDGLVRGSVVVDRRYNLRVSAEDPSLDFWDDDALNDIESIFDNAPKTDVSDMYIDYDKRTFCVVIKHLRPSAFWIIRYEYKLRLTYPLPYARWREELVTLLKQLDN